MTFRLIVNGRALEAEASPETPLLWVLRDAWSLTGTKFGCGIGQCGACTVHLDDAPVRSCQVPLSAADGKRVSTIEGLADDRVGAALQAAWVAHQVPQCGYCQPGFLMAATALLRRSPAPQDAEVEAALTNLCRCGTQPRMKAAIREAAARLGSAPAAERP